MKVTKKAVKAKAAQTGFDLKVDKVAKTITATRKKSNQPSDPEDSSGVMAAIKSMVSQNEKFLEVVSATNTEQAIKNLAEIMSSIREKTMDKSVQNQIQQEIMLHGRGARILRGKVNTRDPEGFIETFTIKVEHERLN